jgi:hypothetical protein
MAVILTGNVYPCLMGAIRLQTATILVPLTFLILLRHLLRHLLPIVLAALLEAARVVRPAAVHLDNTARLALTNLALTRMATSVLPEAVKQAAPYQELALIQWDVYAL